MGTWDSFRWVRWSWHKTHHLPLPTLRIGEEHVRFLCVPSVRKQEQLEFLFTFHYAV